MGFDRGYTRCLRFCEHKHSDDDFVTLLHLNARLKVLERIQNVEVTDESGTRQVCDERIDLAETGEVFRRIVLETPDGRDTKYLTTLASSAYDPIDVVSIYTLRTVIEILFHVEAVSEHREFLLEIAERRLARIVSYADCASADLLAAAVPPGKEWRAADHPESPHALEQIAGYVRLGLP